VLSGQIVAVLNNSRASCDAASEDEANQTFGDGGLYTKIDVVGLADIGEALK
jgi:hypothetical protein